MENILNSSLTEKVQVALLTYGPKFILALVTLFAGLWAVKIAKKILLKTFEKRSVEATAASFVANILHSVLVMALLVSVAGMVGIATTSFVAILGAAGLAVGLALQGSLANFAGGVLILLFKPFKVGDFIEAQGVAGTVEEVQIFCTYLKTPDNKQVILPNGPVAGGNITNYSTKAVRRVDWTFGVAYTDDVGLVKSVIGEVLAGEGKILSEPDSPKIFLAELAESSVNFSVRAWVKTPDYWEVFFNINEQIKRSFDAKGISFPFPQRDVHVFGADVLADNIEDATGQAPVRA